MLIIYRSHCWAYCPEIDKDATKAASRHRRHSETASIAELQRRRRLGSMDYRDVNHVFEKEERSATCEVRREGSQLPRRGLRPLTPCPAEQAALPIGQIAPMLLDKDPNVAMHFTRCLLAWART